MRPTFNEMMFKNSAPSSPETHSIQHSTKWCSKIQLLPRQKHTVSYIQPNDVQKFSSFLARNIQYPTFNQMMFKNSAPSSPKTHSILHSTKWCSKIQLLPRQKHTVSITNINQLMLFQTRWRAIEIHKHNLWVKSKVKRHQTIRHLHVS
jgi:hypothetical protein